MMTCINLSYLSLYFYFLHKLYCRKKNQTRNFKCKNEYFYQAAEEWCLPSNNRNPPDISVLIWFFTFALERDHKQEPCNLYCRPANLKITITFIGNISFNQSLVSKMFPLIISGKKALQLSIFSFCKKKVRWRKEHRIRNILPPINQLNLFKCRVPCCLC